MTEVHKVWNIKYGKILTNLKFSTLREAISFAEDNYGTNERGNGERCEISEGVVQGGNLAR